MDAIDAAAVEQVLKGNHDAFKVIVDRHSRTLFKVAFRMTGNEHDAEEVVQESLLRAFKSLKTFEAHSSLATWLYRIAANQSLDLLKRKKRRGPAEYSITEEHDPEEQMTVQVETNDPDPERMLLSKEVKKKVTAVMAQLTPAERTAFVMRHMEGRSMDEISKMLNIRNVAARNCVFRAVQKLRRALEPLVEAR
jgi:RNA polymerase sigma-70 factor, ECF subfamily